jgi:fibronectin type 3 domain-containing protein
MQSQRVLPEKRTSLLEWRTAAVNAAPFFDVYRRQPGTAAGFLQIPVTRGLRSNAKMDSLLFMVIDSAVKPGITYDYFIVAKDYLGNSGNHSDTVRLQSGGRQNVPSVFNLRTRSDSNGIRLRWARLARNTSLQNILVLRSLAHDTGYAPLTLLPVTDTMYTDKTAVGGQRYFYQLIVQGAFNYSLPTPRVSGMYTGPVNLLPPYGLEALPLPKGVRLSWRYANQQDIAGFKVYRSTSPQRKMQLISDRIPAAKDSLPVQFTDTTAGSDKTTFYYAVAAVSRTSTLGPLSTIISSAPAAISKVPVPAGLRYLWLNDSVVSVTWRDLQRETPGIAAYQVYKTTEAGSLPAGNLLRVAAMNEFTDTLQEGEVRWYRIKTMNTAGISSEASPSVRIEAPVHKPLPPGRVHAYRQGKNIVLDWDGSLNAGIRKYRIYKAENTGKTILVDSLMATRQPYQYTDAATRPGRVYFYYVTSVTGRELESRRSEEVRVRTN